MRCFESLTRPATALLRPAAALLRPAAALLRLAAALRLVVALLLVAMSPYRHDHSTRHPLDATAASRPRRRDTRVSYRPRWIEALCRPLWGPYPPAARQVDGWRWQGGGLQMEVAMKGVVRIRVAQAA